MLVATYRIDHAVNNCLATLCVYEQEGETPLLQAVNRERGSVVRYLINECKMDITKLDQVIM